MSWFAIWRYRADLEATESRLVDTEQEATSFLSLLADPHPVRGDLMYSDTVEQEATAADR